MQKNSVIKHLKGDLLHYSFYSIDQHIDTINKFSSIAAKARFAKGEKSHLIAIIIKPIVKFLMLYFFRLGLLDGYHGFIICRNSAFSAYLKEIKLRSLYKTNLS